MSDDLSTGYNAASTAREASIATSEVDAWLKQQEQEQPKAAATKAPEPSLTEVLGDKGRDKPPTTKPARSPSSDSLGRQGLDDPNADPALGGAGATHQAREGARQVMRNVAEIPKQVAGGVEDAVKHAFQLAAPLDTLANWLNDNVLDTRYSSVSQAKTATGQFTRKLTEFLTGFIPATKMLKAVGVVNGIANPLFAGAISDFVTRDPAEGRLADLWNETGLPRNILTDYLGTMREDSPMTARFKNAVEGMGLGVLAEGLLLGARTVRAMRQARETSPELKNADINNLRTKYGELTDEDLKAAGLYPKEPPPPAAAPEVDLAKRNTLKAGAAVVAAAAGGKALKGAAALAPEAEAAAAGTVKELPITRFVLDSEDHGKVVWNLLKPNSRVKEWRVTVRESGEGLLDTKKFKTEAEAHAHLADEHTNIVSEVQHGDSFGEVSAWRGGVLVDDAAESRARRIAGEEQAARNAEADVGQSLTARGVTDATDKIVQRFDKDKALAAAKKIKDAEGKISPAMEPRSLVRAQKGQPLPEDWGVYVNMGRIQEPDQIKFTIGKMAESMKGHIDEATRGVQTHEATKALADDLGMTVPDLLARRKGVPFNAEEALSARQLWASSGERLVELAKKAAGQGGSELDQFAFRRQMALHAAIQAEMIGARTETARALNAWAIPAGGNIEKARAVDQILLAMGGSKNHQELARRIAILSHVGADPKVIGEMAMKGYGAASMDALREVWVNGLLSAPATHVVNTMSNTLVAFQSIYERQAAAGIRAITGGEGVAGGEAAAMAFGMIESFKDAFQLAAKSLRTGETQWGATSKVDIPMAGSAHAISADAFQMSKETGAGRFVDFLGSVANVPTRLLGAEDEFFKTIGYRMELRAQALRTATQEGMRGADAAKRIAEILEHPPEHIRIASADAALYNTFTNDMGAFGRAVMNLRNIDHPLNPAILVLPFVRTPVNIARYAFERTPFAPLVSQWRADVAAGGARADLALARMSTGTAIMLVAMDMADSGLITGEGPRNKDNDVREAMARQGWQPYSIKIGDRWVSYNRADPFGMTMGFAASIAESVRNGEVQQDDIDEWQEVTAMAIAAVSQVTISKTYLEGFAKFVEVMTDPRRHTQRYVDDLVASFVPATSLSNAVKNVVDPVQREVASPMQAVQARIAGLSDNLPPRRSLWGKELTSESGMGKLYDFTVPIKARQQVDSPIDREMVRLGDSPERIQKRSAFDGAMVNMRFYPKAYDEYVRLSGNELKHPAWGMGAKDYLDAVVSGKHAMSPVYNMMSDENRKHFISGVVGEYRKMAQQQVLANPAHSAFASEVQYLKQNQMQNKMPVLGGQ